MIKQSTFPTYLNILGGNFFLAIKYEGNERDLWKERLFVRGYSDKMKHNIVHDAATARQLPTRLLISLKAWIYLDVLSTDVIQAYVQSQGKLELFFKIPPS